MFVALGSTSLYLNKKKSLKHYIFYKLKNKIGLNGINMSPKICKNYLDLIQKKKIKYIYGYASSIYLLADFAIKNKIKIKINICFPTSEILTEHYRETIENAFTCKVIDCYGASDGGITAFSSKPNFYEVGYNTIVRQNENKYNHGPIIITDLFNYAMPFINYDLGDEILINEELNLNYNYNGQVINKIDGRTSDVLKLGNGVTLTGPGFTILFKDLPIISYRIEKIDDFHILCIIKKMDQFNINHEEVIFQTLQLQSGSEIKISIKYIDIEETTTNGKSRYFKVN
jgi:phenylacetate-CoA ligase